MAKKTPATTNAQTSKEAGLVKRFITYVEDSRAELRKVTWPSAAETRKATIAVVGFIAVMALILGLIDLGLSSIIKSFLS